MNVRVLAEPSHHDREIIIVVGVASEREVLDLQDMTRRSRGCLPPLLVQVLNAIPAQVQFTEALNARLLQR